MKQRFSSLDVKVIAHELSEALVTLRLSNIYDLSSKILLLKFAKPDNKKQLILDSGFRCHLTEFVRTTASVPSAFVARLRKFLKTRRVTSVSQIGTDRIIEFQFSDGQYRLYLEFFASGNVILTDADLKILALMRNVPEGEGQEPQRVGLTYSLENRQNYGGVPPLTKDRVRHALQGAVDKTAAATATGKKIKKKAGDELRRGLVTAMTELPPILIEHAFAVTGFDAKTKPSEILGSEDLFDSLFRSLEGARRVVDEVTSLPTCKGYIIAKKKEGNDAPQSMDEKPSGLLYEDFHPFLPRQFETESSYTILTFDNFNKTVDEFFSSLEGQKLESRLTEREAAAKRKLEAAKQDQAKRVEGLQEAQTLNLRKAAAIEANVERVQEAIDAVAGLLQQGMDWVDIGKLVEREQKRHNPVAEIIKLPMRLAENTITLLIAEEESAEEEGDDADAAYETDSSVDSGDSDTEQGLKNKSKPADKKLEVDIDLGLSPWGNAREYYEQKRTAAVKAEKTLQQSAVALKNAEQKITLDLQKGLKQEKATLQPIRRQMWFEKFLWFISSDGYLVIGGRDAQQNEMLYRRYLRKGDIYVHADLHGAATVIIKNNPRTPDAPIPPSTLSQAGNLAVCSSSAWDSKAGMGAWWVPADQVSKSAPTGEYLPTGSFMVRGKKNFLPPAQLLLGFGVMFKISEESKAKHVKHRLYDLPQSTPDTPEDDTLQSQQDTLNERSESQEDSSRPVEEQSADEDEIDSEDEQDENRNSPGRANPLQTDANDEREIAETGHGEDEIEAVTEKTAELNTSDPSTESPEAEPAGKVEDETQDVDDTASQQQGKQTTTTTSSRPDTPSAPQKKGQPKRGQRGKAKKAAKYKDQDEEDRAAIEELIGASKARQKAEAEAKAKAQREAEAAAARERRKEQQQRQQKQAAEHEEVRRMMLEEGVETLDDAELEKSTSLDALVGTPLPGDEILEVIPYCAPWSAMARVKYKAKMQPGAQKKGKAVKEILDRWRLGSSKKGVIDENARDSERMWPREVELLKALKPEEAINSVPVGKVRVMMAGGSSGGGGSSKGGGQGKGGGGGRGGKGSKRK
ncbi:DUF814 domain-containing protein [Pleurostoma richardsiae]|uniref:Ribosome quality control complex subunit 2 n=1 Tax=Pleurostoma richardsiae TaxID=41990 RepID=A0AA38SC17_9PEZI|nr:DUF814 domain-containing protein [Pleurostoma richardsiae]